jgi:hypothetical protein
MNAPNINLNFVNFVPIIIVSFFLVYFSTLGFYFLAKEGSFKKAFINCFKVGVTGIKKLILPFLAFFVVNAVVLKLLQNLGIFGLISNIIVLIFVVITAFLNRVYIYNILRSYP